MKTNGKKIFAAVAVLCLVVALTALLVACTPKDRGGEGGGTGGGSGTSDGTVYTVNAPEGFLYDFGWKTTRATAGSDAYVEVEPAHDAVVIDMVYANGEPCVNAGPAEDGGTRFEFVMPAEDVDITVGLSFTDTERDGRINWAEGMETAISAGAGTATLTAEIGWPWTTSIKVPALLSTDESVIPNDALSYEPVTNQDLVGSSGSNSIVQVRVEIDLGKVSPGETQIVLGLESGNSSSNNGCIVVTVTVE